MMSHQQQRQQQQQYQMVGGGGGGGNNGGGGGQFGDTTYTKIFVGGLAWETQRETMRNYFEQFGDIQEAVVITDKNTGRSKGYGFVTFKDPDAALRACENPSPVIDGRRANCNLASLGAHRTGGGGGGGSFTPQHGMGRYRPASSGSQSNYQASSSMYLHQPAQYAFPYSAYGYSGYSQENMYPMNYYSLYGGGQPYYTTSAGAAATSASPGVFPNFYPFYSQGYGFQYHPQMVHYPYLPQNNHNSTGILSLPSSVASSTSTTTGVAAIAAAVAGTDSATSPVSSETTTTTTKQNSSVPCS